MPYRRLSKEMMEEKAKIVLKLHDQGLTYVQISKQVRIDSGTVGKIIRERRNPNGTKT